MDWMELFDMAKLGKIAALTLVIVQYIKVMVPENYIRVAGMLVGIGASLLIDINMVPTWQNMVMAVTNGIMGAILADTTYGFLSDSNSTKFSLPSKKEVL